MNFLKKKSFLSGVVVYTFNPTTQKAETKTGRFLCEFKARMVYREF